VPRTPEIHPQLRKSYHLAFPATTTTTPSPLKS